MNSAREGDGTNLGLATNERPAGDEHVRAASIFSRHATRNFHEPRQREPLLPIVFSSIERFLASANVGIDRTQACRETIAKAHLRDLRQAREREAQARRSPSPPAPPLPVTDPVASPDRSDGGANAGADTQLAPDPR